MAIEFSDKLLQEIIEYRTANYPKFIIQWTDATYYADLIGSTPDAIIHEQPAEGTMATWKKAYRPKYKYVGAYDNTGGSEAITTFGNDVLKGVFNTIGEVNLNQYLAKISYKNIESIVDFIDKQLISQRHDDSEDRFRQELFFTLLYKLRDNSFIVPNGAQSEVYNLLSPMQYKAYSAIIPTIRLTNLYDSTAEHQFSWSRIGFGRNTNLDARTIGEGCRGTDAGGARELNVDIDGASLKNLRAHLEIIEQGGRLSSDIQETGIKPSAFNTDKYGYSKQFLFIGPSSSYEQFIADKDFNAQLSRGIIENKGQPQIYKNRRYRGHVEGVDILIDHKLSMFNFTHENKVYAVNFILGASAMGYLDVLDDMVHELRNAKKEVVFYHHEMMDLKSLLFPSKNEKKSNLLVPEGVYIWITPVGDRTNINNVRIVEQPIQTRAADARNINTISRELNASISDINKSENKK